MSPYLSNQVFEENLIITDRTNNCQQFVLFGEQIGGLGPMWQESLKDLFLEEANMIGWLVFNNFHFVQQCRKGLTGWDRQTAGRERRGRSKLYLQRWKVSYNLTWSEKYHVFIITCECFPHRWVCSWFYCLGALAVLRVVLSCLMKFNFFWLTFCMEEVSSGTC